VHADGARLLAERIAQHQHWRQAEAVRARRQPAVDPDADALEEMYDGVRVYGRETQRTTVNGQIAVVAHRLVKRLVQGYWEASLEPERVDPSERR
jgi:hypothetical protein